MIEKKVLSKKVAIALILTIIILSISLVGAIINYTSIINSKDITIQSKDSQIQTLTSQKNQIQTWLDENKTLLGITQTWLEENISYYNSQTESLNEQIVLLTNQRDQLYTQIANLQTQVSSMNTQIQSLNLQIEEFMNQVNTLINILEAKGLFYDDFIGSSLSSGWNIENREGSYSLNNSILTISSSGQPYDSMTIYRSYTPQSDSFTVSARVKATTLPALALRIHAGSLPIFGSTQGAQLEFGYEHFDAAWESSGGGWTWTPIYSPTVNNVWFILELKVQKNPFTITFNLYDDAGNLLGTLSTTNIGFGYTEIRYVCLEVWSSPSPPTPPVYQVDWIKII